MRFAYLLLILLVCFPAFVEAEEKDSRRAHLTNTPASCENEPVRTTFDANRLYFKKTSRFHEPGFSERLGGIDVAEYRVRATFPGVHTMFTGPASLFGWCGWWPDGLTIPVTIENQVVMKRANGWDVDMSMIAWGPKVGIWWNVKPELWGADPDSSFAFTLEHVHWSGGDGDLVNNNTESLRGYIERNRITNRLDELNVVSLGFAHSFAVTPLVDAEYRIGKNLWQVPFDAFLEDFGGLTSPAGERESYRYGGFFNGRISIGITPLVALSGGLTSEFSQDEQAYMTEAAVDLFDSWHEGFGLRLYYREYRGMPQNSLQVTRWGVWSNAKENGGELIVRLSF